MPHWVDLAFDAGFGVLSIASLLASISEGTTLRLAGTIAATCVFINLCNFFSLRIGCYFSKTTLSGPPFCNPLNKIITRNKFVAQMWQLVVHVSMAWLAGSLLLKHDWISRPWMCASWAELAGEQEDPSMLWLYYIQLSIWLVTCFSHRFVEERHKDYYVMFGHHIATIAVIVYSLLGRQLRYGLVVFFLHDFSDVFLDVLKIGNILKLEGRHAFYFTEIAFVVLMTVWISCRHVLLPWLLWYGIWQNLLPNGALPDGSTTFYDTLMAHDPSLEFRLTTIPLTMGGGCLVILECMHVWWTFLLLRIAYRVFMSKEDSHDVGADEYEGASDEEDKKDS